MDIANLVNNDNNKDKILPAEKVAAVSHPVVDTRKAVDTSTVVNTSSPASSTSGSGNLTLILPHRLFITSLELDNAAPHAAKLSNSLISAMLRNSPISTFSTPSSSSLDLLESPLKSDSSMNGLKRNQSNPSTTLSNNTEEELFPGLSSGVQVCVD